MRADRLLSILLLLQTRGRMTAQTLAEQLEVSERTIYRDIEALSFAGIPIYTERGPGGGCELLDGYQTRLTGLTAPEIRALFLLNISIPLADLGLDQALEDALLKLSATLPADSRENATQVRQRIHIDTTTPTHARPMASHLELIQKAIWQDYTLSLTFKENHTRFIDPYGLVSQQETWYLVGSSAGAMQVVRVTQIQAAALTDQHFTRPTKFNLATYWAERVPITNHDPAGNRNNQAQKKAKTKADLPPRILSQRGVLAQNKKRHFFTMPMASLHLRPSLPPQKNYNSNLSWNALHPSFIV